MATRVHHAPSTVEPIQASGAQAALRRQAAALRRQAAAWRRAEEAQQFLVEASGALSASLEPHLTLQETARLTTPRLADWCVIDVVDESGQLQRVAAAHADPRRESLVQRLRERGAPDGRKSPSVWCVLRNKQSYLGEINPEAWVPSFAQDAEQLSILRRLGLRSLMVVPLVARGRTLGAISLVRASVHQRYDKHDLALAEELARRCALAVDNARLFAAEQRAHAAAEGLAAERAAVLGQIADGVVLADPDGRVSYLNAAARMLFGLEGADPQSAELLLGMDGRASPVPTNPLIRAACWGESVAECELRLRRADGDLRVVEGRATPVVAEDGTRLGAVLTLRDVTARRQLERQKEEFFADVSHDLRTPVAAICGAIEVVLDNAPPGIPPPLHRMLVIIEQEAERMRALVDDVLELTRLEAGIVHVRLARCDLRGLARQAARAIEPMAAKRGQRVVLDFAPARIRIIVDAERLKRALVNLLSNAQRYGKEGGAIRLSLFRRGAEVLIGVADDGPGIRKAEQARIFERFYRASHTASRQRVGSGLGLPIARAMVELHGGRVWVESAAGAGATFWISLPTRQRHPIRQDRSGP